MTSPIADFKLFWNEIPTSARKFILTALIILVFWKLAYQAYLLPHRTIDKPLTMITGLTTAKILSIVYNANIFTSTPDGGYASIYMGTRKILRISDGCNALEPFIIYCIFIVSFPNGYLRRVGFLIMGICIVFMLNVLRCSILADLSIYHKTYTDILHHYVFSLIVYGCIFGLMVWYASKRKEYV
ncbi:hypothetical protein ACFOW1_14780 [Parasediminibacterium paludis]|uniref:Exosortase/archaeosortase family protein n=1 Tax=Parasediminibacterium paludis TaxID=908966 RepID=A0ABV8PZ59_9BACT